MNTKILAVLLGAISVGAVLGTLTFMQTGTPVPPSPPSPIPIEGKVTRQDVFGVDAVKFEKVGPSTILHFNVTNAETFNVTESGLTATSMTIHVQNVTVTMDGVTEVYWFGEGESAPEVAHGATRQFMFALDFYSQNFLPTEYSLTVKTIYGVANA